MSHIDECSLPAPVKAVIEAAKKCHVHGYDAMVEAEMGLALAEYTQATTPPPKRVVDWLAEELARACGSHEAYPYGVWLYRAQALLEGPLKCVAEADKGVTRIVVELPLDVVP